MTVALRLLNTLAKGPGNTSSVHQRLPDVHLKTVQLGLSSLNARSLVEGQRMPGSPSKLWSITEAGLAELRRAGMGAEPPSLFGCFGARIGRISSVFELGRAVA